jgi:hypothetical protein
MSAVAVRPGRHDSAERRRSLRHGRERGCWVYIAAETLVTAGIAPDDPPPLYRMAGYQRSAHGHSVIVSLYPIPTSLPESSA